MIRRGAPKAVDDLGYEERRTCALEGCGATFRPSDVVCGQSTEYHCSPECAAAGLMRRLKMEV